VIQINRQPLYSPTILRFRPPTLFRSLVYGTSRMRMAVLVTAVRKQTTGLIPSSKTWEPPPAFRLVGLSFF
jgi:hypothetical protein